VKVDIYIEGAGEAKLSQIECRKGFRKLLETCGFKQMPGLTACGGRDQAYSDFKRAHAQGEAGVFVVMLVDSEDPVADENRPWEHLARRDGWRQPPGATDEQVLLMTTCMETWIAADLEALRAHYGACLRESALPPQVAMESRLRREVQTALVRATRDCKNKYEKGKRSFEVLGRVSRHGINEGELPCFRRLVRILGGKLRMKSGQRLPPE
jgi:hypothetical protein